MFLFFNLVRIMAFLPVGNTVKAASGATARYVRMIITVITKYDSFMKNKSEKVNQVTKFN